MTQKHVLFHFLYLSHFSKEVLRFFTVYAVASSLIVIPFALLWGGMSRTSTLFFPNLQNTLEIVRIVEYRLQKDLPKGLASCRVT